MKIRKKFLLSILVLFMANMRVDAANFVITAPSSANVNSNFIVSISHSGDTIGSLQMAISITNADCSVQSTCSGGVANCNGGSCLTSFNLANGLKSGEKIITLECHSTGGKASFVASVSNKDAWDVEGMKQINISSATKSVIINGTTSTTKNETIKTTSSRRLTTGKTTSSTKKTSTSQKKETTNTTKKTSLSTDKTTSSTTTKNDITTSNTSTMSTTSKTAPVYIPGDLKLNQLKIVGYNINFKPNFVSYTIDVDENVDELYIIASPADENAQIDTVGLVDITGKDFIQIRVFNENTNHEINYKINIRRSKKSEEDELIISLSTVFKLVTFSMIGIIFIFIIFFTIRNKSKRKKIENNDNTSQVIPIEETKEEIIPNTEEELKQLFDELDNEQGE